MMNGKLNPGHQADAIRGLLELLVFFLLSYYWKPSAGTTTEAIDFIDA